MKIGNVVKTIICVALAGFFFITSVLFKTKILFIPGALFDWLPIIAGWMKIRGGARGPGFLHGIVTLVAYAFGVAWVVCGKPSLSIGLSYGFLLIWFTAVLLGSYASIHKLYIECCFSRS